MEEEGGGAACCWWKLKTSEELGGQRGIKMDVGAHAEVDRDQLTLEGGSIDRIARGILQILQK